MKGPKDIKISEFDYPLPDNRIAKFPLEHRDESKLLVCRNGHVSESQFFHLPEFLPNDALLVFNNTKVIHARIFFQKSTGSVIEVFCLEPYQMAISQAFEQRSRCSWVCFVGNNKKWKEDTLSRSLSLDGGVAVFSATRREAVGNAWIIDFEWTGGRCFSEMIDSIGVIPLPPYLHRNAEQSDALRYQTVYAEHEGSVAAPTAGLHFTDRVFSDLKSRGISTEFITLHVGAGTFKPVSCEKIGDHEMHVEKVQITYDNIKRIIDHDGHPVIAVGTTSVRTLESVYWFGVKLKIDASLRSMHISQWDPYELVSSAVPLNQSYQMVLQWMDSQELDVLDGETQLMIAPGYKYRVINGIVTNFHQPKSTLLLLVSALIGDQWKICYQYALEHEFRFLSYGDSCLFLL